MIKIAPQWPRSANFDTETADRLALAGGVILQPTVTPRISVVACTGYQPEPRILTWRNAAVPITPPAMNARRDMGVQRQFRYQAHRLPGPVRWYDISADDHPSYAQGGLRVP